MISVLIPVYNYHVYTLVDDLHNQLMTAGINFEIIVMDDGSTDDSSAANEAIIAHRNVQYILLEKNIGRQAIRFKLAEKAAYPFLLFLDCDSVMTNALFVQQYINNIEAETVIVGGRSYHPQPPSSTDLLLHWRYGTEKESKIAETRSINPYRSFMTNNFLIPRQVMLRYASDVFLNDYGHEDTWMGYLLWKDGIKVKHINNNVQHGQLISNTSFIHHTELAIKNLLLIYQRPEIDRQFFDRQVELIRAWRKMKPLLFAMPSRKKIMKTAKQRAINNSSVKWLSIYKLLKFHDDYARD